MGTLAKPYFAVVIKTNQRSALMTRIFNAIKQLAGPTEPQADDALRRRIRQLETENQELREKLVWRGPWML